MIEWQLKLSLSMESKMLDEYYKQLINIDNSNDSIQQILQEAKINEQKNNEILNSLTNNQFNKEMFLSQLGITSNYLNEVKNIFSNDFYNFNYSPIKELYKQYDAMLPHANSYLNQFGINTSLSTLRSSTPLFFNYEDNYGLGYQNLYKKLNSNWNKIIFNEDYSTFPEILDTKTSKQFSSENIKDVVGIPQLFNDISQLEVVDFLGHLEKFPFLALKHPIGKKIYTDLEAQIEKHKISINKIILYRSRIWNKNQKIPYTVNNMWNAPIGIPAMGRFNPSGVSYLYMSDSLETSKSETKNIDNFKSNIMKTTLKSKLTVLDFSEQTCPIFEFCNKKQEDNKSTPKEYLVPNFIAQCISYLKAQNKPSVDGIKYKSTLNPNGFCYVFFYIGEQDFVNSEIIE